MADWFGYQGQVHGATPNNNMFKIDYVTQVSTYQILKDMKIASLLQKLVILL